MKIGKIQDIPISLETKQRAQSAKLYIERRYTKLIQLEKQKKQNWELLYKKMQLLKIPQNDQQKIKSAILHKEAQNMRLNRKKITVNDYQTLQIIGRGAFGQVRLCRSKVGGQPVAIKKMKKINMINKNKVIQVRQQKDILAKADNNQWIVELKCSFQDDNNLYLVMEYLSGGDMMNLLIKRDVLTQQQAKFYIAQLLMALNSVHQLNYIHRDLKPDNILIDHRGHLKLSDFGLCKHIQIRPKKLIEAVLTKDQQSIQKRRQQSISYKGIKQNYKRNRKLAFSTVGTPDYVAPQVQAKNGYTQSVDWWSLGIILYEMLVGYPPFVSEHSSMTWNKIMNWKKYFHIPKQAKVSPVASDLLKKLICDQKDRLGRNGVNQIMNHPFFQGVNWNRLRQKSAPNIPYCKNLFDTSYFDTFFPEQQWEQEKLQKKKMRKNPAFIGYTFKKDSDKSELLKALLDLELGNFQFQIQIRDTYIQGLDLQRSTVHLTQIQRKTLFKKDKTQSSYNQLPQMFTNRTINISDLKKRAINNEQQILNNVKVINIKKSCQIDNSQSGFCLTTKNTSKDKRSNSKNSKNKSINKSKYKEYVMQQNLDMKVKKGYYKQQCLGTKGSNNLRINLANASMLKR